VAGDEPAAAAAAVAKPPAGPAGHCVPDAKRHPPTPGPVDFGIRDTVLVTADGCEVLTAQDAAG